MDINIKKAEIRKDILQKRGALDSEDVKGMSQVICKRILETDVYKSCNLILLYADFNNEVCLEDIYNQAIKDGKRVAYPKCNVNSGYCDLDFYKIENLGQLSEGYKGIKEPDNEAFNLTKIDNKDALCIVPGLAFDYKLMRIGYGKGFYDNYLRKSSNIYTIGVCYDFQIVDMIPTNPNDYGLNMVVTNKRILINESE